MSALKVNLGENSYDILIDGGLLSSIGSLCADRGLKGRVAVITNALVLSLYGNIVRDSLIAAGNQVVFIEIPDGEEYKNAVTLNQVYDELIAAGLDRSSFIVALGGGVVGDLAGFAAATYLRGIPFIQVPTTLLAQVDSSVGGKTAIDHASGKNLIGAFYQPKLVVIDLNTLKTLPKRELSAGLAEVVKYGVALDGVFFDFLEQNSALIMELDQPSLARLIMQCCKLKAGIVEKDEKESGLRAVLNYGHTLGHAFETLSGYGILIHGEAVAIGILLAARISKAFDYCSDDDVARIVALLSTFGLSVEVPCVERSLLIKAVSSDKKNRGGVVSFICNRGIGSYVVEHLAAEQLLILSGLEV